jgi:hypothetical protein
MKLLLSLLLLTLFISCECQEFSERVQNKKQEEMNLQAVRSVGMPAIIEFSEKRQLKDILELRDKAVPTITYVRDMGGKLHKICNSVGFGIPYATQYTNPQRVARGDETPEHGNVTIPQADPNGLYSPSSADATWVLCLNPKTEKISPTYIEDRITVSTFELE